MKVSYYSHAYARGVDKRTTFFNSSDYIRFFLALTLSLRPKAPSVSIFLEQINNKIITPEEFTIEILNRRFGNPRVTILSAVLMPNHFHLQMKFSARREVSKLLQRLIGSYTKYFNKRYTREGRLFSSKVHQVSILTDEQNLYLTKYIHTNPAVSTRPKSARAELMNYRWSTLAQYLGNVEVFTLKNRLAFNTHYFCDPSSILTATYTPQRYADFIFSEEPPQTYLSKKDLIDQSN